MKTRSIARGIVGSVAALLGVMAAGCSADVSDPQSGEAEIGSTAEALTNGSADTSLSSSSPDMRREWAFGCSLRDVANSTDYFAIMGGYDNSGTPVAKSDIYMAPKGGTFVAQTATLNAARGEGVALRLSDTQCLVLAGFDKTNTSKKAELFELTSGSPATLAHKASFTVNDLNVARDRFQAGICVDSNSKKHAFVVNGRSTGTTALQNIEVSSDLATSPVSWTQYNSGTTPSITFQQASYDFGMAQDGTANQFITAGGLSGSGRSNKIELIKFDSSCVPSVKPAKDNTVSHNAQNLSASIEGNLAVLDTASGAGNAKFGVTGGDSAANTLWTSGNLIEVNDWTNGYVTLTSASRVIPIATHRPTILQNGTTTIVAGGDNGDTTSPASIVSVQEFRANAWTANSATNDLAAASSGLAAAYFPSGGEYYFASGRTIGTGLVANVKHYTSP